MVIALVPAATAVLSAARNSGRLPRPFWLACLTGLIAVAGYAATSGGASAHTGDLWLGAAVLSCAVGYVEGARVSRRIGAIPALCWAMLLLAPLAAPLLAAAALTRPAAPVPASAWAGLGYVGVISMFAASMVWYRRLAAGGTARCILHIGRVGGPYPTPGRAMSNGYPRHCRARRAPAETRTLTGANARFTQRTLSLWRSS